MPNKINFKKIISSFLLILQLFVFFIFPLFQVKAAEELYFIHQDHLGSTTVITDEAGKVVQQERNFPYGESRLSNTALESAQQSPITERGYTSQIKDAAVSLYYYNARYYDSQLGTFISADPAGERFAYAGGNPVMFTDPTGYRFVPPNNPWPWDAWISRQRDRYYSSDYRKEQASANPFYGVWENISYLSSLRLLTAAGTEALFGNSENAQAALSGSVALLFPDNSTPVGLAMQIAGTSATIRSPAPWDGQLPGRHTIRVSQNYQRDYQDGPFTGTYIRRPENLYPMQERLIEDGYAVKKGGRLNRQAWINWAASEGVDVYQVPSGHPRLGVNRGIYSPGGWFKRGAIYSRDAIYIKQGMDDLNFLGTFGHEMGHHYDRIGGFALSSMETEARQTYWSLSFFTEVGDQSLAGHYWRRYQLLRGRNP